MRNHNAVERDNISQGSRERDNKSQDSRQI